MSMATRKELIEAVRMRYEQASRTEKARILDEFTAVAGYHRKHAIRALKADAKEGKQERQRSRLYSEAVLQALVILWEARHLRAPAKLGLEPHAHERSQ